MPETVTSSNKDKFSSFQTKFASEIIGVEEFRGDLTFIVKKDKIRDIVFYLMRESENKLDLLLDIFAIDYLKLSTFNENRFAVVYQFGKSMSDLRLRVKVPVSENDPSIDSVHDLIAMANWFEREAWDLYGIVFKNHPNLQRILCHQEFEGHPLRKDYPSDKYQRLKTAAPSTGF